MTPREETKAVTTLSDDEALNDFSQTLTTLTTSGDAGGGSSDEPTMKLTRHPDPTPQLAGRLDADAEVSYRHVYDLRDDDDDQSGQFDDAQFPSSEEDPLPKDDDDEQSGQFDDAFPSSEEDLPPNGGASFPPPLDLPQCTTPQEVQLFDLPTSDVRLVSMNDHLHSLLHVSSVHLTQTLTQTVPQLLQEMFSSGLAKTFHKLRLEYARLGHQYLRASELGNLLGGYYKPPVFDMFSLQSRQAIDEIAGGGVEQATAQPQTDATNSGCMSVVLSNAIDHDAYCDNMWCDGTEVRFTSLPWIERQLVAEWRTYEWSAVEKEDADCDSSKLEKGNDRDMTPSAESIGRETIRERSVEEEEDDGNEDVDYYDQARTLAPRPLPRPQWENAGSCYACDRSFSPTLHRHHCRRCGHSFCNLHANSSHVLAHLGYDPEVPERVCLRCKSVLDARALEERVTWRLARCRDYLEGRLTPYFETGVDTVEDAALRLTKLALSLARSIPLGAQAYVAIETVEVVRKHGLKGVYGLLLRKDFLAAADLLLKVLGINKTNWPLSVHELSAAIFYALAQHRALRGLRPDGEELIHSLINHDSKNEAAPNDKRENWPATEMAPSMSKGIDPSDDEAGDAVILTNHADEDDEAGDSIVWQGRNKSVLPVEQSVLDETDVFDPTVEQVGDILTLVTSGGCQPLSDRAAVSSSTQKQELPFEPVCEAVSDDLISSLLFYAPLALDFIYAECEVDMQLLAAQQGWRLVYAALDQNHTSSGIGDEGLDGTHHFSDKPASALFAHDEHRIACLSIRGTATIQDVVTDIRATPVPFPQRDDVTDRDNWTSVSRGEGLALCGMAGAATNLFRETADSLLYLAMKGYKIRIVGHSLGGGVAALLGILITQHMEKHSVKPREDLPSIDKGLVKVYGYGTPACADASLADYPMTRSIVTNVVMHDDVVPRLTPTSVRSLLKHLLYIRETWVKTHLSDDLSAITERAYRVWPQRLRGSFTLLRQKGVESAVRLKKSYKNLGPVHEKYSLDYRDDEPNEDADSDDESEDEGVDVEGDTFFDTLDDPLNESDDESSVGSSHASDWEPLKEHIESPPSRQSDDSSRPQMLNEFPLPRMFIPGSIVHIYTYRGGYKAARVPRTFRSLRRISLAGNMLSDHTARSYYEGLLEVKAVRSAKHELPEWVGFAEDSTCCCCASLFTWASTSHTEAQAARDKHNCRACGGLVCDPCSKKRVPIPQIGITASVRVCDACFNRWGTLFPDDGKTDSAGAKSSRRRAVVDELASRIPSICPQCPQTLG